MGRVIAVATTRTVGQETEPVGRGGMGRGRVCLVGGGRVSGLIGGRRVSRLIGGRRVS
ncbi:hypothetical protein DPMN_155899 [Dreissena polymorpha]|uniref:Uncharacterized protein n=1 Tax=Dreissena polymorpha TaxID=45954 RepID=A0A9D4FSK7_DREPO|nr:hypothetical protein DPMN_155899 [Dreissena polymorpha]